ncbi:MAG: sodium:calcium antiporter [Nitrososphaeraceae archaeon]
MAENNIFSMLFWLGELTLASWILSYGAEHLSEKFGAKFVGRVLLSIATTLPEIAIVIYAAAQGSFGIAIGSGLGSNLLMMTLGLAIMLIIATTRLSKAPLKHVDVSTFKNDMIFLIIAAVISFVLFLDGFNYLDGFIFVGLFAGYIILSLHEMRVENKDKVSDKNVSLNSSNYNNNNNKKLIVEQNISNHNNDKKKFIKAIGTFLLGAIGILFGAEPFIHSLEGVSVEFGISAVVLAVIISPIAGEMPEKISMMILARKGAAGASIAIANVLGSKILNNTLLLAVAVFAAMYSFGFNKVIELTEILYYQIILVTLVTIVAVLPMMFRKKIGLRFGFVLLSMYIICILIQFLFPQNMH